MTNSERRVGLVRKAVDPPATRCPTGRSSPAWPRARPPRAVRLAHGGRCLRRVRRARPRAPVRPVGLTHERLRREGALQWPVPACGPDGEGTRAPCGCTLAGPSRPRRPRAFRATPHAEPADAPAAEFPLVLTTGRVAGPVAHYDPHRKVAGTARGRPEPFLELHPADAPRAASATATRPSPLPARERDPARARDRRRSRGDASRPSTGARCTSRPARALNALTRTLDPVSRQAELKATAVRVEHRSALTRGVPRRAPEAAGGGRRNGRPSDARGAARARRPERSTKGRHDRRPRARAALQPDPAFAAAHGRGRGGRTSPCAVPNGSPTARWRCASGCRRA